MGNIISLQGENVMKLKAVRIDPEGNVTIVGGKNAQGKSCVLNLISFALDGKGAIPDKPVRDGQKKATAQIELKDIEDEVLRNGIDGLTIKRTMTRSGGGELIIKGKDGEEYPSPQTILDKLKGERSFDPLKFKNMNRKEQLETLKRLIGLDFTSLDKRRDETYAERTIVNREGKRILNNLESSNHYDDIPEEEVSIAELSNELTDAIHQNEKKERLEDESADLSIRAKEVTDTADGYLQKIEELKQMVKNALEESKELNIEAEKKLREAEEIKVVDEEELREKIDKAEETNKKVRANQEYVKLEKELEVAKHNSEALTRNLENIDTEKEEMIKNAKFPIEGLSLTDNGVEYKGIPFDQASSAEQLTVSVAIGFAMNPKLKILLIRDGSLLDKDSLKLISDMADKEDGDVWIEKVTETDCHILIEDGEIAENHL
jgi:hypothetical protein